MTALLQQLSYFTGLANKTCVMVDGKSFDRDISSQLLRDRIVYRAFPSDSRIQEAIDDVLIDFDFIAIVTSYRKMRKITKNLRSHQDFDTRCYSLIPDGKEPRWFIPVLDGKLANLDFIKPSGLVSKSIWPVAPLLNRYGMLGRIFRGVLIVSGRRSLISGVPTVTFFIRNSLREASYFSLYSGTNGPYQKKTYQLFDRRLKPVAYGKLAEESVTRSQLRNEMETLNCLAKINFDFLEMPALLNQVNSADVTFMIQSVAPSTYSERKYNLDECHINAQAELFNKTRKGNREACNHLYEVENRILISSDRPREELTSIHFRERICDYLRRNRTGSVPLGLSHGDFAPWNILQAKRHIFVYDWEDAAFRVPFWDLIYFVFLSAVSVKHQSLRKITCELMDPRAHQKELMASYSRQIGIRPPHGTNPYLVFVAYELLLHYECYSNNAKTKGIPVNGRVARIMEVSREILERML